MGTIALEPMPKLVKESVVRRIFDASKEQRVYTCQLCSEDLQPHTMLTLARFAQLDLQNGRLTAHDILDSKGKYMWWPYWFHEDCMEDILVCLHEAFTNDPARIYSTYVCECATCKSHIRHGEFAAVFMDGKLTLSDRCPDGQWSLEFDSNDIPYFICMECMEYASKNILDNTWEDLHNGLEKH